MSLHKIHDFELALLEPCLGMSERGVLIDEPLRLERIKQLSESIAPLTESVQEAVRPLLCAEMPKAHLFREVWTCPCCKNGARQRKSCWRCAGFEKKPTKKADFADVVSDHEQYKTADLGGMLIACMKCAGKGQRVTWRWNLASEQQTKVILYDLLKLPARTKDGKLRSDEDALKTLVSHDKSGVVAKVLRVAKAATMLGFYKTYEPADDGRVHTFYNPAGTETGRFNSRGGKPNPKPGESFALTKSANLQNPPKKAATKPLYNVRECFIASPDHLLVEGDLSGAEAWVTAACCGDNDLLERLRSGEDIHRWTAAHIYGKAVEDVTKQERVVGKFARHALNYAMGWKTFMDEVNAAADTTDVTINSRGAEAVRVSYHALHPLLGTWYTSVDKSVHTKGFLTTCWGRKRTFFGRRSESTTKEAIAYEPQSTVADLLNHGMLNWWERYEDKLGNLVMQVHDSVVLEVPTELAGLAAKMLKSCLEIPIMVHGVDLTIPVEVSIGRNWAAMK